MSEIVYFSPKLGKYLFWAFLFTSIIANLIISTVLVPIMLVMSKLYLYGSVMFIGLSFGFLLNSILISLEKLDKQHHIMAGMFIPAIAAINVFIFTKLSNDLIGLLKINNPAHNPITLATAYVISFTFPYLVMQYIKFKKK